MTSQTIQLPPLNDFNAWACFWYYDIGVNVIPTDAEKKKPKVTWKSLQKESLSEGLLNEWISQGLFKDGIGVITGNICRGKHIGKYLTAVDLDNKLAIVEFSNYGSTTICWQDITFAETRDTNKLHIYFITYEQIPDKAPDVTPEIIFKKKNNLAPSIEVKGSCKKLIYPTPNRGYHPLSPIEIIDFSKSHSDLINHISEICNKYGLTYIKKITDEQYAQYNILNDVTLTDDEIQKIVNLWIPYYRSGNRHVISEGTAGLYAKNGLTINTANKLSLELSRITYDDETRLVDVETTYNRLLENKSIQSIGLLEPIIGDGLPLILSKFHDILRPYNKEEDVVHNGSNISASSISMIAEPNHDKAQISDNPFIQLIARFIHERNKIRLEPKILLKEIILFATNQGLDYLKVIPQNSSWLGRTLTSNSDMLIKSGILLNMVRSNGRRYIILKTH